MLKSEPLSRDVITTLGLTTNPDIYNPGIVSIAFRALKSLVRGQPALDTDIPASIIREFQSRLDVKRVRETYMVSLRFKSGSPELAATIVNTIMRVHLDRESENRRNSIKAELDWMDERLTQLQGSIQQQVTTGSRIKPLSLSTHPRSLYVVPSAAVLSLCTSQHYRRRARASGEELSQCIDDARAERNWRATDWPRPHCLS
jgi:hypothetical protein